MKILPFGPTRWVRVSLHSPHGHRTIITGDPSPGLGPGDRPDRGAAHRSGEQRGGRLGRGLLGLILVVSIHLPLQARGVVAILFGLAGWSTLTVRLVRALRRRDQSGLLPHVDL